ncbi:hypothetical protein JCM8202_000467 [Rhodotorula sphaerocarpa]
MSILDEPACTNCGKHASELVEQPQQQEATGETVQKKRDMLVCSRCQKSASRLVHYCSRTCQVSHFKAHKPICGVDLTSPTRLSIGSTLRADPNAPFQPPQALLFHLAALTTLPPSAWPTGSSPPSFLFFPSPPKTATSPPAAAPTATATGDAPSSASSPGPSKAPDFVPIVLPEPARNLFNCLQLVAFETGNPISVNLMYSILLDEVAALGGAEPRLVEQLAEEYRLDGSAPEAEAASGAADADADAERKEAGESLATKQRRRTLREVIDDESEPTVDELFEAIGGQKNTRILVDWQVYESERKRSARQKVEEEQGSRHGGGRKGGARKGRR